MAFSSTDFDSYAAGSQPPDWTKQWDPDATFVVTNISGADDVLRVDPSSNLNNAIKWDSKDSADAEVIVRLKIATWAAFMGTAVVLKGSGTSTTETGYMFSLYTDSAINRYIKITQFNASAATNSSIVNVGTKVPATSADVMLRCAALNGMLYIKVWAYGTTEPSAWDVTWDKTAGEMNPSGGWHGLMAWGTGATVFDYYDFAIDNAVTTVVGVREATVAAEVAGDGASIGVYNTPEVSMAAVSEGDTADIIVAVPNTVDVDATAADDAGSVELDTVGFCDFAGDLAPVESAFEGAENTFFDFQTSFPIVTEFTGSDLQYATFAVDVPILEASFTSPYGESLNITLPMLETAFFESDQGYGDFAVTIPVLLSSFVGGELLTESFDIVCVNARTKAHSTYTNFPFNSFARFNGVDLACSSTGIHALGGNTDAGAAINADMYFGLSDLGTSNQKRVDSVWLRTRLTTELDVKLKYDETVETVDRVNTHGASVGVQTVRARGARGDQGNFIQVGVSNVAGSDFEILDMEAETVTLSRR